MELHLAPSNRRVYLDPHRATLLGARGETDHLTGWLFHLHSKLLGGAAGERVVGGAGLLLVLLALTGLVGWWPGRRKLRLALTVAPGRSRRRTFYDLHRAGGFYTVVFLLAAGLTGSGLVFHEAAEGLLNGFKADGPAKPPHSTPLKDAERATVDQAVREARAALPGATVTFVTLPQAPEDPVTVRMRTPGKWHPNGRSYVYLDAFTGRVLRIDDARLAPRGTRIYQTFYPIHIGSVGGIGLRLLYVLLGLAPTFLAVTGFWLWRRRPGPKRGRSRLRRRHGP